MLQPRLSLPFRSALVQTKSNALKQYLKLSRNSVLLPKILNTLSLIAVVDKPNALKISVTPLLILPQPLMMFLKLSKTALQVPTQIVLQISWLLVSNSVLLESP